MKINENEHIEYINNELKLIVSKAHTFGTDALLLASFASPSKKALACDFGTGCGIIPFYWVREGFCKEIYTAEIQENGYEQLCRSIELNNLDKIHPFNCDLRNLPKEFPKGQFDVVTMNPPYKASGAGIESQSGADKIARHETMCTFKDICTVAAKLLNFGGKLCMCIRPERLCELFCEMKAVGIEPKRLRLVAKCAGKAPWLALIEGRRGGKSGMTVEPELFVHGENGYSDEMKRIYADYLLENRGEKS